MPARASSCAARLAAFLVLQLAGMMVSGQAGWSQPRGVPQSSPNPQTSARTRPPAPPATLPGPPDAATALSVPPGTAVSTATAINDSGVIVGYGGDYGDHIGFVVRGSGLEVLNNLIDPRFGWNLKDPTAIDANGRIVGTGFRYGKGRAFLLTPFSPGGVPAIAARTSLDSARHSRHLR